MRSALTVSLVWLTMLMGSVTPAMGQLPAGWEKLPAGEFVSAAQQFFASDAVPLDEREAVAAVAWDRFLKTRDWLLSADLDEVTAMLKVFGRYRGSVSEQEVAVARDVLAERLREEEGTLARMNLYDLCETATATHAIGRSMLQNAPLFTSWMNANDWRSLPTHDLYNLFGFVSADAVDRRKFSARWTGSLKAPRGGEYVFRQARVYKGDDSQLRIWIDGTLVFDTAKAAIDGGSYVGGPVPLTGGQAVSFRAELVHDTDEIEYSVSAPMILVTWDGPGAGIEIIPTAVFAPPQGIAPDGETGLLAEYFADTALQDLRVQRVDRTLDLVWTWPPAASAEVQASRDVFEAIVGRLLDDEYMRGIPASSDEVVALEFDRNLWRIAYRMSATERLKLVALLRRNPEVLRRMSPEAIGRLYRGIYMLPGDSHWELLGEWATERPQPRCQAGWFPGWGEGGYQKYNTDFYWAIGHMMGGPYAQDADALCDAYLVRPNGECNLAVAYAAAYAVRDQALRRSARHSQTFFDRLQGHLDDEQTVGDIRVTWLIAMAYAREIMGTGPPTLRPDSAHLVEAQLVAESPDYKFWALQEAAARSAALGRIDILEELVEGAAARDVKQNKVISAMREIAQAQVDAAAEQRAAAAKQMPLDVVKELERRREVAVRGGAEGEVARIDGLLESARSAIND